MGDHWKIGRGCCSYRYCKIREAEKWGLHYLLLGQRNKYKKTLPALASPTNQRRETSTTEGNHHLTWWATPYSDASAPWADQREEGKWYNASSVISLWFAGCWRRWCQSPRVKLLWETKAALAALIAHGVPPLSEADEMTPWDVSSCSTIPSWETPPHPRCRALLCWHLSFGARRLDNTGAITNAWLTH